MKKHFLLAIAIGLAIPSVVAAHPGRTDSSGCHTCKTNCPNWGLSYGEYHCHNSKGVTQPVEPVKSTYGEAGTGYTTPAPEYAKPKNAAGTDLKALENVDFSIGEKKAPPKPVTQEPKSWWSRFWAFLR